MSEARPHRWEKSYPAGVRWDAPLATTTLPTLLDRAVAAHQDRPAVEYRDRSLSYRQLGDLVNRAAGGFARLGVAGANVALYLPNTPLYPVAFFGALKAGARIVNLSPLDAERELVHKLKDSGARVLVTTTLATMPTMALKLMAQGLLDRLIVGDDAMWGGAPAALPPGAPILSFAELIASAAERPFLPQMSVNDVALLQYTGGTTGAPRAAMLSHGNLSAAVSIYEAWTKPQDLLRVAAEKVLCVLPLFHIYALTTIMLRHLSLGSEILLRPRFDVETTLRDIEAKRVTVFPGVPTMWVALYSHAGVERCDFSSLRHCSSGGAPLPAQVGERFERLIGHRLGGGWGMTETAPAGTNIPQYAPARPGSVGVPLPGIYIDVVALDDPQRVLPANEVGEFRIKGPNVMQGYWKRPDETKAAFVDGHFLTGDIGRIDEDGYVYLVDRKKEMIISGGFNVYPRVVEDAIYEHPDVEEVVVVGVPDDYRGEMAKAFVKLRAGAAALTLEALREFLGDKLGRHEMPAALEVRPSLPRSAVGKLSRRALLDEQAASSERRMKHG